MMTLPNDVMDTVDGVQGQAGNVSRDGNSKKDFFLMLEMKKQICKRNEKGL